MAAVNSSKAAFLKADLTLTCFEKAGCPLHREILETLRAAPRNRQNLCLPPWESHFIATSSVPSFNTNLESLGRQSCQHCLWLEDSKEKFHEDIISVWDAQIFFKNLASFMTFMGHVWVRCSKPMKYKTWGRTPNLFKVLGQWCRLLSCSWQWSLDSLWINSKMERKRQSDLDLKRML